MNLRHLLAAVFLAACVFAAAQGQSAETPATPVLHFRNGDFLAGRLLDSAGSQDLVWRSEAFASPLRFPVAAVLSVQFPLDLGRRAPDGPYCFELAGGDTLYGSLLALDDRQAVLEVKGLGPLHVERPVLHRFSRASAADLIFSGPSGLTGWTATGAAPVQTVRQAVRVGGFLNVQAVPGPPAAAPAAPVGKAWREEGGQLATNQVGATLRRDFRAPPLARYEIELSWNGQPSTKMGVGPDGKISWTNRVLGPNFELALGVSEDPQPARQAFRFEVWEDELVVVRETKREADLCTIQKLPKGAGRVHLQIYLDQEQGRVLVYSPAGEKLADLIVPDDKSPALPTFTTGQPQLLLKPRTGKRATPGGLQLVNRGGDLKLERLSISRWSGAAPQGILAGRGRIHLTDGSILSAEIQSYDAAAKQFVVTEKGQQRRLDERTLQDIILSQPGEAAPRSLRALRSSGSGISGDLLKIEQEQLWLTCPGVREPLALPLKEMHALIVLSPSTAPGAPAAEQVNPREGRLELAGVSLRGKLLAAREGDASCLVFQPRHSESAGTEASSPLARGVSGRLVYRDPPPPPTAKPAVETTGFGARRMVVGGTRTLIGTPQAAPPRPAQPTHAVLHLRSGDAITCRVQRIDEHGVSIQSDMAEANLVPHEQIRALELDPTSPPIKIDKSKKERLLTLPRMQRDNPPTQLIRSLEGDYLRGRLLSMDEKQLHVELRLETRALVREQIARIIWLHPDEISGAAASARPADAPAGTRVQAVPTSGNRLTFLAQELAGDTLSGRSPVLGACHVKLPEVDQLLIGGSIEQAAATLAFHQWKLKPAAEPLPTPDGDASSGEGLESVLVGKPAPDIELDLLDGKKFRLADYKNKVLVLDFWASWCGPCLQAMPQVDRVAREFADRGVQLVAINLEETPERVRTALERLKLETTVALDRDGRAAERYGATAIPQTVIIDRDGKVARLFVGGGPRFDEQLRQALTTLLGPRPPAAE